jgi:peptide/nickel transport system permease protein
MSGCEFMEMRTYIIKRALLAVPTLLGISLIVFIVMYYLPGDVVDFMLILEQPRTDADILIQIRAILGLDKPWYIQYYYFLRGALTGDLGLSFLSGRPVVEEILSRVPNTLSYQTAALIISVMIGIPAGVISAVNQYTKTDSYIMVGALLGVSFPVFFIGLVLIFVFSLVLGWFPSGGAHSTEFLGKNIPHTARYYLDYVHHMILPTITLALATTGYTARLVRSSMLSVLREDYIMAARSKGLKEKVVIYKHALKNAVLPVITVLGLRIAFMISGAPIVETIFAWPGLGKFFIFAIRFRDYLVVVGITCVMGALILAANILIDITYKWLDPRVAL